MTHGQIRAPGHERNSTRHRQPTVRTLKDTRCRDCQIRQAPAAPPASPREGYPHKRDFAPTKNPFSILAELDQRPHQTQWDFDFTQIPNSSPRRRGKRGGKHVKPKVTTQQPLELRKSEVDGIDEMCMKMAEINLEERDYQERTRSRDQDCPPSATVRHHWLPQFRPNSDEQITNPAKLIQDAESKLPQPLKRCLSRDPDPSNIPDFRRKESRFFPLPAFLAAPDTAARHHSSRMSIPPANRVAKFRKQPLIAVPSIAQKAAASAACRAIAARKSTSTPMTITIGSHASTPRSHSPLSLTSAPLSPPTNSPLMHSPFAPFAITPSSTASPTLTTSPILSATPSLALSPSVVSMPDTPRSVPDGTHLPLHSRSKPTLVLSPLQKWTPISIPSVTPTMSPLSLVQMPVTSARPVLLPHECLQKDLPSPSTSLAKPPAPRTETSERVSPVVPFSSVAQMELADFLKMGHANPCWCSSHNPPRLETPPTYNALELKTRPATPVLALDDSFTMLRRRPHSEVHLDSDSEVESFPLSPSSTSSSFELLGMVGSPTDSKSENGGEKSDISEEEMEWAIVAPGPRYGKPATVITDDEEFGPMVSAGSTSSITIPSWPSPPLTPAHDSAISLPLNAETSTGGIPLPNNNPWSSPTTHPSSISPIPSVSRKRTFSTATSSNNPLICTECMACTCACAQDRSAESTGCEWPTLQEAMTQRRKRQRYSKSRDSDTAAWGGKMWDGVLDWCV